MKKIIMIMFLFSSILLVSCSMGGRLVLESSKDKAKDRFQELVEIIKDDDTANLKDKFAVQTQNEISDLYEQIEEMFEYIIGDIETWEMDSAVEESVSTSGGNKIIELNTQYIIQTSHDVYYILITECTKDRFDSEKVGLFAISVISKEDREKNSVRSWTSHDQGINLR